MMWYRVMSVMSLCVAILVASPDAQGGLINAGFETGDLNGWTAFFDTGSATVVTSHVATFSTYVPDGTFMLAIVAGNPNVWQTVSQRLALGTGESVSGWAAFDWREVNPVFADAARVRILDSFGTEVAVPYFRDGSTLPPIADDPPAFWSFTAAAAGDFTLEYGSKNAVDSLAGSVGLFDVGQITQAAVPEPSSIALMAMAGFGLIVSAVRNRRRG